MKDVPCCSGAVVTSRTSSRDDAAIGWSWRCADGIANPQADRTTGAQEAELDRRLAKAKNGGPENGGAGFGLRRRAAVGVAGEQEAAKARARLSGLLDDVPTVAEVEQVLIDTPQAEPAPAAPVVATLEAPLFVTLAEVCASIGDGFSHPAATAAFSAL